MKFMLIQTRTNVIYQVWNITAVWGYQRTSFSSGLIQIEATLPGFPCIPTSYKRNQ